VVGGFIEQQQVGAAHQCLCEIESDAPTTGKIAHCPPGVLARKPQSIQKLMRPGFGRPGVETVQRSVQLCLPLTVVGGNRGVKLVLQSAQSAIAIEGVVECASVDGRRFLGDVGNHPVSGYADVTAVEIELPQYGRKQAALARAVVAGQAEALPGVQLEISVSHECVRSAPKAHFFSTDHSGFGSREGRSVAKHTGESREGRALYPGDNEPEMSIVTTFDAVAFVESPYRGKFAIPRQSGLAQSVGAFVRVQPEWRDGLTGLESVSHVWLVFVFHGIQTRRPATRVRPPRLGGNQRTGVFATRSTHRPNPVGLSLVKLESVRPDGIEVSGIDLDAFNAIAPAAPEPLPVSWHEAAMSSLKRVAGDAATQTALEIEEVLCFDARPGYHRDSNREYAMEFADLHP